jgi:hypothetical protein
MESNMRIFKTLLFVAYIVLLGVILYSLCGITAASEQNIASVACFAKAKDKDNNFLS